MTFSAEGRHERAAEALNSHPDYRVLRHRNGAAGSIAIEALRPRRVAATIARHLGPGAERAADPRQRLAGCDDPVRRDSLLDPGLDGGQRIEIVRRPPAFAVHHPRHQEQARPILGLTAGIMRQAVVP